MDFAFGQTPCAGQIARSFALFRFSPEETSNENFAWHAPNITPSETVGKLCPLPMPAKVSVSGQRSVPGIFLCFLPSFAFRPKGSFSEGFSI